MEKIYHFRQLRVYSASVDSSMLIFKLSKQFPPEEKFSLTDQIRRSSRSVASNIAEAWGKRRYVAAFVSKLSDSESEAYETQTWIEFAVRCGYVAPEIADEISKGYDRIVGQLISMISDAHNWILREDETVYLPEDP